MERLEAKRLQKSFRRKILSSWLNQAGHGCSTKAVEGAFVRSHFILKSLVRVTETQE